MFVVASIGMAAGGGLYVLAAVVTIMTLGALQLLGLLESRLKSKAVVLSYDLRGSDSEEMLDAVNRIVDRQQLVVRGVQYAREGDNRRVQVMVEADRDQHRAFLRELQRSTAFHRVSSIGEEESERE